MKKLWYYSTLIGRVGIAEERGVLTDLHFSNDIFPFDFDVQETELLWQASVQLNAFLNKELRIFSLPLGPKGSVFMKKVWDTLINIPYGQTRSYKDIAEKIGKIQAYRAIGTANNKNPIPIFIPCHRVIGSNGNLTGYKGSIEIKSFLLEIEKTAIS